MTGRLTMAEVNALPPAAFAARFGSVWEHAGWVAERVVDQRPFASASALHAAMLSCIHALPVAQLEAFLSRHPDLGGLEARQGTMTAASTAEQGALALTGGTRDWEARNAEYRSRFGFPFILCLRRHSRASAEATFEARRNRPKEAERRAALEEIAHISRLRLADRIEDHGLSATQGRIAITVTDRIGGRPAAGLALRLKPGSPELPPREAACDAQGRVVFAEATGPLRIGLYDLDLATGAYFAAPFPSLPRLTLPLAVTDPEAAISLTIDITPHGFAVSTLH